MRECDHRFDKPLMWSKPYHVCIDCGLDALEEARDHFEHATMSREARQRGLRLIGTVEELLAHGWRRYYALVMDEAERIRNLLPDDKPCAVEALVAVATRLRAPMPGTLACDRHDICLGGPCKHPYGG